MNPSSFLSERTGVNRYNPLIHDYLGRSFVSVGSCDRLVLNVSYSSVMCVRLMRDDSTKH